MWSDSDHILTLIHRFIINWLIFMLESLTFHWHDPCQEQVCTMEAQYSWFPNQVTTKIEDFLVNLARLENEKSIIDTKCNI